MFKNCNNLYTLVNNRVSYNFLGVDLKPTQQVEICTELC